MFSKKEIDIYESDNYLSIVADWFSPVAYFLAFFSVIWCGFLVVWYTIVLAGGAPLIAALFPLIHVAAGIGMVYYTLCLFRNKTYIDVDDNYLTVAHKPIPWWRGNKEIPTDEVKQLYVKQKISKTKNGSSVTYQLRAKLKNGKDQEIFNLQSMESHQVFEIEERLEKFMGIIDEPVRGEHANTMKTKIMERPRRQGQNVSDSPFAYLYDATLRDYLNIKSEEHKVSAISQYDWNNGDSDKFYQLLNKERTAQLIYLQQNKAILSAFAEESVFIGKTGLSTFPKDKPPSQINIGDAVFYFANTQKGDAFVTGVSRKMEITQWCYLSEDNTQQLRFIDYDGQLTCYQGEKLAADDLEQVLDLNKPPERVERMEERRWDEEDFV